MSEDFEADTVNYREEILRLVAKGKIKHTTKYVEKASDETLEKIYKGYVAKQLDETNEQITNTLIKQLSELLTSLGLVEDGKDLESDLGNSELLKRDTKCFALRDTLHSANRVGVRGNLPRKTYFTKEEWCEPRRRVREKIS